MEWSRVKPAGRVLVDDLCVEARTGASARRLVRRSWGPGESMWYGVERDVSFMWSDDDDDEFGLEDV